MTIEEAARAYKQAADARAKAGCERDAASHKLHEAERAVLSAQCDLDDAAYALRLAAMGVEPSAAPAVKAAG